MEHPTEGVIRVQDFLFVMGIVANHKRVRRLLRLMGFYIPMKSGFMYMTAIIDVYSRYIVGWGISTLDGE